LTFESFHINVVVLREREDVAVLDGVTFLWFGQVVDEDRRLGVGLNQLRRSPRVSGVRVEFDEETEVARGLPQLTPSLPNPSM